MDLMMVMTLFGGLGLFLYGMHIMGEGLQLSAGARLRKWLEVLTTNRVLGLLMGLVVTMTIQSSSATTVMVIGFVNAGLMNLTQAVGVIMGANIGTTVTAQLVALDLKALAPISTFVGVAMIMFFKKQLVRNLGMIVAGLGILFTGMHTMSAAMKPLGEFAWFQNFMVSVENPFVGVLVGAALTGVIQSSSASVAILQALAVQGLIPLGSAVYILCGQNIGTCVTALLACAGTSLAARRAAVIHLLFNVMGTLLFALVLGALPLVSLMESWIPNNAAAQIANMHTLFNIVATLVLFPLGGMLVKISQLLVPGQEKLAPARKLEFLDQRILGTPAIAVAQVVQEVDRMAMLAKESYQSAMEGFFSRDDSALARVRELEEIINYLNHEITHYLVQITHLELSEADSNLIGQLYHVVNDLERIGDHAENIMEYAVTLKDKEYAMSDVALAELREVSSMVDTIIDDALSLFRSDKKSADRICQVSADEERIDERTEALRAQHIHRLTTGVCKPTAAMLYNDMLLNLERIADHAINIATIDEIRVQSA